MYVCHNIIFLKTILNIFLTAKVAVQQSTYSVMFLSVCLSVCLSLKLKFIFKGKGIKMYRLTVYFPKGLPIPSFRSYQELASQCLLFLTITVVRKFLDRKFPKDIC